MKAVISEITATPEPLSIAVPILIVLSPILLMISFVIILDVFLSDD
jgi:hypothetical protein